MYPVQLRVDHVSGEREKISVILRYFYVIPIMIVATVFGIGAWFAAVIAWFALVFTGRYPQGLYEFNAKYLRLVTRANAYYWLETDRMPPFNGDADDSYPVRLAVPAPQASYDRVKVGLRFIFLIPALIVAYVASLIGLLTAVVAWFTIVFGGEVSESMEKLTATALASVTRATAYALLLTDEYPPAWDAEEPVVALAV